MSFKYFEVQLFMMLGLLLGVSPIASCSGQSSTDYFISSDIFSSCGGMSTSFNYSTNFTMGQSATIGDSSSDHYGLQSGYWPRISSVSCVHHGDVNFSGSLTASDAQMTFLIVVGFHTPSYDESCAADCNGDGSITAGDAQNIFMAVLGLDFCDEPLSTRQVKSVLTPVQALHQEDLGMAADRIWIDTAFGFKSDNHLIAEVVLINESTSIDAFTFYVAFNHNELEYIGCREGALFSDWIAFDCREIEPGIIVVAAYTVDEQIITSNYGSLVELTFLPRSGSIGNQEISLIELLDDIRNFDIEESTGRSFYESSLKR